MGMNIDNASCKHTYVCKVLHIYEPYRINTHVQCSITLSGVIIKGFRTHYLNSSHQSRKRYWERRLRRCYYFSMEKA